MNEELKSNDTVQKKSALQKEWNDAILCINGKSQEEIRIEIETARKEKGDAYAKVVANEIDALRRF